MLLEEIETLGGFPNAESPRDLYAYQSEFFHTARREREEREHAAEKRAQRRAN